MLQNGKRGVVVLKFLHQLNGRIDVKQVVVRQGFSMERLEQAVQIAKVLTRLVWILAVTQSPRLGNADVQGVHGAACEAGTAEVGVDHGVVM